MRETTVARNYAETLFMLGERHDRQRAFERAIEEVAEMLESDPRVRRFLETPKVEREEKKRVLIEALRERVPAPFLKFLLVVVEKRRQGVLLEIAREYLAVLDEHLGRTHVRITLAREPGSEMREEITAKLSDALESTVVPHVRVDPEILGGIVVRYGDRVLNGSLRRRMATLRRNMLEAEVSAGFEAVRSGSERS